MNGEKKKVAIRRATAGDLDAIATINVESWAVAYEGLVPAQVLEEQTVETFLERAGCRLPFDDCNVAVVDGRVVGYSTLLVKREPDDDVGEGQVGSLYVHPNYWRGGVGSALLEHAESQLADKRVGVARVWVLDGNDLGIGFYQGRGWELDQSTYMHACLGHELMCVGLLKNLA